MKKPIFCRFVALFAVSTIISSSAFSAPIGNSNWTADYLFAADNLSRLTAGVCYDSISQGARMNGRNVTLDSDRIMTYLGFSILPWLTPYITAGEADTELKGTIGDYIDAGTVYGGGVKLNILDHDILDPALLEDRFRINASLDYLVVKTSDDGTVADWNEFRTALTVGLVNDTTGNKRFVPHAIEIFVGPVYSSISGDVESRDEFGYVAGVSVHYSERVTLDVAFESVDGNSIFAGVHVRL